MSLFKIPYSATLVTSAAAMVLVSWYRVFIAGTIMVDGHSLQGLPQVFAFTAFILSLAVFSLAYYRLWRNTVITLADVKKLAQILVCTYSLMLPMLSNDIFSYLVFGDAVNKGIDVYTNPQCTHFSSYFPYITSAWSSSTCAYGSVILALAMASVYVASGKIIVALAVYKILVLLVGLLFIELAARISMLTQSTVRCFTFIVLNPVFVLQGVGQLHADLIAITFTLAAIYFMLTNRWIFAFVMVALAVATKMNYVLMLPFFLMDMAIQGYPRPVIIKKTFTAVLVGLITLAAVYLPFYTSLQTLTTPFKFHFFQNPSKCIGEILSYVIYFAPQLISGHQQQLKDTVKATSGPGTQVYIANVIVKICQLFALCASLLILIKYLGGKKSLNQWFRVYVRTLLLFVLYYMHIFNPWYLMMILPFMWAEDEPTFMHWLFVLTCFISVQDTVCMVNRNSITYAVVLVLTFSSVMLYLYRPRYMFFKSLGY